MNENENKNKNEAGPALTWRQEIAWPKAVERLRRHYDSLPADFHRWEVSWSPESRPGRGHAITATYADGEFFAQVLMDVYGYPSVSIARLDLIHADSDEECGCDECLKEREGEAEDAVDE